MSKRQKRKDDKKSRTLTQRQHSQIKMSDNRFSNKWIQYLLLLTLTVIVYIPALQGEFVWDDRQHILFNKSLRSLAGLYCIWFDPVSQPFPVGSQFYPLTYTVFWLGYQLWGLNPIGYHLVNVLLHGTNAIILLILLKELTIKGAWLAAAIFAVHPIQVESVGWITELKNVQSLCFFLLSALLFVRAFNIGNTRSTMHLPQSQDSRHWYSVNLFYILSFIFYIFALLSKTVTSVLPAVLIVLLWWKKGRIRKEEILALVPFFVIGLMLGLQTVWLEKHAVGAIGDEWELSIVEHLILAGRIFWFYLYKLFLPLNLMFIYPRWEISAQMEWQYVFPLAVILLLVVLWIMKGRLGKGPFSAFLMYVILLAPALGFFKVFPMKFSYVADHFQYHANFVIIALISAVAQTAIGKLRRESRYLGTIGAILILLILSSLTWQQCKIFKDLPTLWRETIKRNPTAWIAHNDLGAILLSERRPEDALVYLLRALELQPENDFVHNNLGHCFIALGNVDKALEHFKRAIELNPENVEAYYNLGNVLTEKQQFAEAELFFKEALLLSPDNPIVNFNYANCLAQQGKIIEALHYYHRAEQIQPNWSEPRKRIELLQNILREE